MEKFLEISVLVVVLDFGDTRDKAEISTGAKKAQKFTDHRNCTGTKFSKRFVLNTWKLHYLLNKLHKV